MDFLLAKELSTHSYILAGKKAFFHRFCDSGFKTKWTGLWQGPRKFLEYFAFKVNDTWLSSSNCYSFELSEVDVSHHFSVNEIKIREFLFIPENFKCLVCFLFLQNLSDKQNKVKVELEAAVNIRDSDENWHDRLYEAKLKEGKVIVNSEKGSLVLGSSPTASFTPDARYKDHYPSEEKQRCFVPGNCYLDFVLGPKSKKDLIFIFSMGKDEKDAFLEYEEVKSSLFSTFLEKERKYQDLLNRSRLETGIKEIDELFRWSAVNLEKLAFESELGFGYFAGYPWFTQFWGRDLGWILPAVIDLGNFEDAKRALATLARFQSKDGAIPNIVYLNGKTDYNSVDSTPLWIIALHHYVNNSGDIVFIKRIKENIFKALQWLKLKDSDKDGFIEHSERETWMDTLDRSGKAVEIQSIWIASLKAAHELAKILEGNDKIIEEEISVEQKFEKEFWDKEENFYFDRINNGKKYNIKTINSIFPVFFGISQNPKLILEKIESDEFSSSFGVRTLSKNEAKYNPAGYHTGSVWGWTTGLVACSEFKNNRPEKGLEYLKIIYNNLNQNCVGAIGEAWNPENNDTMLEKEFFREPGACLQGWSAALVVRCVDEFMLGFRINALENTVLLSPSFLPGAKVLRRKRIGNDIVDFIFQRVGSKVKVNYKSENKKEYRIIVSPNF